MQLQQAGTTLQTAGTDLISAAAALTNAAGSLTAQQQQAAQNIYNSVIGQSQNLDAGGGTNEWFQFSSSGIDTSGVAGLAALNAGTGVAASGSCGPGG
jgi:hypothetical protein